jgi:2,4-dienoyl-CoA reductase-like NADH-dependent reductase (Old Yellow Enzyme family)/thioredoxin reductase
MRYTIPMQNRLFQTLTIGPREARNRIIFGSHTTNFAQQHVLSSQHADYYASRAAGGAGSIVLEEHIVHPSDFPYERALFGYAPETPQAISRVSQRVHAHSSLAIVQLNHNGQQSSSDHHQHELWAPSAVQDVASREIPKTMEHADIAAVLEGFALAASHAARGNADGVELQVADRSLLRQFLSPLTNQRNDQYGGSLENRLRFVQETIEAVDAAAGKDRVLGVRLCADELAPWGGITPEQGAEIARLLADTGRVDYLTITMGSIFSTHMFPFHASMHTAPGYAVSLASSIKAAVTIPVFAAGRIMNADQAERILAAEQADGVEMIRPLIADPNLPRLSQAGQANNVRPCIACNQGCQVRSTMNVLLSCNVNPDVIGNEGVGRSDSRGGSGDAVGMGTLVRPVWGYTTGSMISTPTPGGASTPVPHPHPPGPASNSTPGGASTPTPHPHPPGPASNSTPGGASTPAPHPHPPPPLLAKPTTLHVIGGGPAGMEAARTAALRGKQVILYERETTLGGAVTLAAKGPGRGELQLITDYLQGQLEKLSVDIHLGVDVTAEMMLELSPGTVLVATGARPGSGLLPIPGHDLPHVIDVRRILRGERMEGKQVVIIDETESHGLLSVAELLATEGYAVEIITEDWYVGRDLVATHDVVPWMQRTLASGVVMTTHTTVVRIEPGQVVVTDRFVAGERTIRADIVVFGVYERPAQELYYALKGRVPRLMRAGDCVAPRRIEQAILEGRQIGEQV